MKYIHLIDSTFREGKQSSSNRMLLGKARRYVQIIDKMGVEYMEIMHPYISTNFLNEYQKVVKLKTNLKIFTYSRINDKDLTLLQKIGVKNVSTSLIGNNEQIIMRQALKIINWAQKNNIKLRLSIENSFQIDKDIICRVCKKICKHKVVSHICFADSNGCATPEIVGIFFQHIHNSIMKKIPIEFHFHNDQGLAAANFYTVYKLAKKTHRDILFAVSVSGMGERNGILSYGDVLSVVSVSEEKDTKKRYRINFYKDLLSLIFPLKASFNRDPLSPSAFGHVAASHIKRVIENNKFQTVKPKSFGFIPNYVIGELFSADALIEISRKYFGLEISSKKAKDISTRVRNSFSMQDKDLTISELETIVRSGL
ncbi:MAG: hypothetical protein WC596_03970 [Candidatus Shapirobacteria bacterium]